MNLKTELLKEHSQRQTNYIVENIGNSQKKFDELFKIFCSNDKTLAQRASWCVSECVLKFPKLISPYFSTLIEILKKPPLHIAVKRNTLRILQAIEIPEKYQGEVLDIAINCITCHNEPPSIKAFAITIVENLLHIYPELVGEIKIIIEEQYNNESAAFKSRAKKILKTINNLMI